MQPREPVTKGTVRLLTGLVVFPVTWITVAVLVHDRWYMRLGWIVYQIAACVVAIPLLEAIVEWFRGARCWWHLRDRRGLVPDLLTARADVVDAVRRATGAGAPSGNRVPSTAESAASSARTPTR
jgi:hypothetical protein